MPLSPLQARFTEAILRQMAGISFPPDRIFSQTVSGQPKSEVLEMLAARHPHAPSLHFVEDKMSTLEKVGAGRGLGGRGRGRGGAYWPGVSSGGPAGGMLCLHMPAMAPGRPSSWPQVAKLPSLEQYHLYLVDWGYNTQQERRRAAANERIAVVDIQQFMRLAGAAESATA